MAMNKKKGSCWKSLPTTETTLIAVAESQPSLWQNSASECTASFSFSSSRRTDRLSAGPTSVRLTSSFVSTSGRLGQHRYIKVSIAVFRIPSDDSSDSNIIARLSAWTDPVYLISSQSYLVPRQDLQTTVYYILYV